MTVRHLFIQHWQAKLASLFLAVAIFYLIDGHLQNPERVQFPIPGTDVNPLPDNSPNSVTPIPGGGTPSAGMSPLLSPPPVRIEHQVEIRLHRLDWMTSPDGDFAASVRSFPGITVPS